MDSSDPLPTSPRPEAFLDVATVLPALAGDGWRGFLRRALETLLGINRSRETFRQASWDARPGEALVAGFGLELDARGVVESIPATGGAVIVANHPFGGADAISLIALGLRKRSDFLILANEVAAAAPGVGRWFLPLSILGDREAARKNALTLRAALDHLRGGGLLAVFPAGEVSTWQPSLGRIADAVWSPHVAALARKAKVPVLPLRFFGENPAWFHFAGKIHPLIRTALLPRVLLAMRGKAVHCRTGTIIQASDMEAIEDPTALLRERVETVRLS